MRCGECGSEHIITESVKESLFDFKDFINVPLQFDYEVRTCQECRNQILSNVDINQLDKLIQKSIKILTKLYIEKAKSNELINSQLDLALLIGCTPQYITNLKNGKGFPSFSIFTLLRHYADHPELIYETFSKKVSPPPAFVININTDHNPKSQNNKAIEPLITVLAETSLISKEKLSWSETSRAKSFEKMNDIDYNHFLYNGAVYEE